MTERWHAKADAFNAGWRAKFGADPSLHAIVLGLSVAEHETRCGDSWPGENNWGAVQVRTLTIGEKSAIAERNIATHPNNVTAARAALEAAIEAGTIPAPVNCALHVDSSPGKGWYWVFFAAFPSEEEGAALFVHVLAENRHSCRAILEADGGTEQQLAAAMYASRYFEGFYKRGSTYARDADGKWHEVAGGTSGEQLNIDAYAGALRRHTPVIRAALADWTPSPQALDPVAIANAARLSKLTADLAAGRGEGLDALEGIPDTERPKEDVT